MTIKYNRYVSGTRKFSVEQRVAAFWSKVAKAAPDDCWLWCAGRDGQGYGIFWNGQHNEHAHRFALKLKLKRNLYSQEHALHNCPNGDNPQCCNPAHLWVGTNLDNIQDKVRKGRHHGWKKPQTPVGEKHHRAKLSNSDVVEIKRRLLLGHKLTQIAKDFHVTVTNIWMIKKGRSRKIK